jgi:hypothetical protein
MDYFNYLLEFDLSRIRIKYLLIILTVGFVTMKVIGTFCDYIATKIIERKDFKFTLYGDFFTYFFLTCAMITVTDYNRNYHSKFMLSNFKPDGDKVLQINEKTPNQPVLTFEKENTENTSDPDYFSWKDIQISDDIDQEVNKSEIIQSLGLTSDELTKLKKILSDPNPDPQNAVGHNCGQSKKKCKWCGKEMSVNILITTQDYINNLIKSATISIWVDVQFQGEGIDPNINNELQKVKTAIISGINTYDAIKYTCSSNLEDFCSEKCKYESTKQ